ncbi:hypothetical protein EG68_01284 [Paragonimus skrjabini miyazakii]|uniref:Uncharacterized protein n=1 Tax=Paragonimus skrjabini miyazakii TaxID=59628 RepID=A0A8S9ZC83_9TREM|nr:hypothetical protein EG68_01284 [Paragonimus skrjabini miyazakii]
MKRARSLGGLNQLLTLSVRLQHYVELSTTDDFTTATFQYRLEQHLVSPWREPKKSRKLRLCITYTSLILNRSSWWPYRSVERIDFSSVERFITFQQAGRFFAIGLQDHSFAEKQFVVMSTKTIGDLNRLIQTMETQLTAWKNMNSLSSLNLSKLPAAMADSASSTLGGSNYVNGSTFTKKSSNQQISLIRRPDGNLKRTISQHSNNGAIILSRCECPSSRLPRFQLRPRDKPVIHIIREDVDQTSFTHLQSYERESPTKSSHKEVSQNMRSTLQQSSSKANTSEVKNKGEKAWEVDIKYVRHDPILGNVLDNEGSVYLYTAHQIRD